jgi:parallel beta-helix repeat protein
MMAAFLIISASIQINSRQFPEIDGAIIHESRARILHDPILITGNSDLISTSSSEGWPGNGSSGNPIIIMDLKIIVQGSYGVSISDTNLHIIINNLNITTATDAGILISGCSNITISENLLFAIVSADAIRVEKSTNCTIKSNIMDMEDQIVIGYNGIKVVDSPGCLITFNKVARMTNNGISVLGNSDYSTIEGNYLDECMNIGIHTTSDNNEIKNNTAFGNGWGIKTSGMKNLVMENRMKSNGYGIEVSGGSSNIIDENIVTRNFIGIKVVISVFNIIKNNYIAKSSSYGIDLYCNPDSSNTVHSNHLYYNNGSLGHFDSDHIQARDLNMGNIWYNTSSNRGNFWFDWTGTDGNSDGIVDLSYPVSGDGDRDWKPWKIPEIPDVFHTPWRVRPQPQSTYIDITWEAPWYGPGIDIQRYLIYRSERGGGELYLDDVAGDTLTFRDTDVKGGRAYYYYIVAENTIALSNQSKRIKSSPDTQKPNIGIYSPESGDFISSTSVTILYSGSDNIALDRYEISLDGGKRINNRLWTNITFHDLEEGEHTVEVTAFDLAEHNRTDTINFLIDISNPLIMIEDDGDDHILTTDTSPTIYWDAEDMVSGIKGFSVSLDGAPFYWIGDYREYTISDLSPGEHVFSVTAKDEAGNSVNDSVNITVDPGNPKIDIIYPEDLYINNTGEVSFYWYAEDDITGISHFSIRWDSGEWIDIGNTTNYTLSGMGEGSHHVYIRAHDMAGNNITTDRVVIIDTKPPEAELIIPIGNGLYNEEFNIQYSASDMHTGISSIVLVVDDGDPIVFSPEDPISLGFSSDGNHTIILEIIDGAGNSVSITRDFYFDITRPTVTSFTPKGKGVNVSTSLVISFSEEMDRDSIMIDMEGLEGSFTWNEINLTFDPDVELKYSTRYSFSVSGSDLAGNALVPFDWYFDTESDIAEGMGVLLGRIVDGSGIPLANASVRTRTGEIGHTNETGWFRLSVIEGQNHIIVSYPGYSDSRIEFNLSRSQTLKMGDIPIKKTSVKENEVSENEPPVLIIVMITMVVILLFGALVGWQIKKTRDASRIGLPDTDSPSPDGKPVSNLKVTREYNNDGHTVVDHFDG